MSDRRNDIDVLRVFAVYLLFVFHTAMVFNPAPFFHIRNDEQSMAMLVLAGFIGLWHMPLFFVLAGWSLVGSLRARGSRGFLGERVRRLLVPLIAGCVLFGPVMRYLELRSGFDANYTGLKVAAEMQDTFRDVLVSREFPVAAPFHETFLEFWPTYFSPERFAWGHLWFLAYLLTFTLLYRPLLVAWMRRSDVVHTVRPAWVYAPIVPLALAQVLLRPHWPGLQNLIDDWANFAYYSTFLLVGFLLARYPAFERAVHGEARRALGIALGVTALLLGAVLEIIRSEPVVLALTAVAGWCYIVALLGYAKRRFAAGVPGLPYLAESSFPVYILHQVAIIVTGFWIIQLPLGIASKFVLVLAASVASTMAIYQLVVRPIPAMRFLFGMKVRASAAAAPSLPVTAGRAR